MIISMYGLKHVFVFDFCWTFFWWWGCQRCKFCCAYLIFWVVLCCAQFLLCHLTLLYTVSNFSTLLKFWFLDTLAESRTFGTWYNEKRACVKYFTAMIFMLTCIVAESWEAECGSLCTLCCLLAITNCHLHDSCFAYSQWLASLWCKTYILQQPTHCMPAYLQFQSLSHQSYAASQIWSPIACLLISFKACHITAVQPHNLQIWGPNISNMGSELVQSCLYTCAMTHFLLNYTFRITFCCAAHPTLVIFFILIGLLLVKRV